MPCILKIRVLEARDLPVMDRSSELTDAYVEVKFGDFSKKTEIRRKTLNPTFQEDFRIEVPNDSLLQDAPLELKVWDYDIVSSNDIIGVVYIDLNCLLMPESSVQIAGWFPIYDTLKGIRGELNVTVKLEFFGNVNEFKDASAGVQFFSSSGPFDCYQIEYIYGFVEELILDDDPEYDWVDNFRASRISNEERQLLLYHLSGKIRRQLGRKVLESGGNAVLAYWQEFDLEGESGIVARGYGTNAVIKKLTYNTSSSISTNSTGVNNTISTTSSSSGNSTTSASLAHSDFIQMHTTSPKRAQFSRSDGSISGQTPPSPSIQTMHLLERDIINIHPNSSIPPIVINKSISQEIPLLTLRNFAPLTIVKIGGVVMARSVKLLSSKASQQTRDNWWQELREEIQSHAKFLGCNAVVGYTENNTLERKEGLCVLSVCGTAVQLRINNNNNNNNNIPSNTNDIQSSESIDLTNPNLSLHNSNSLKKKKRKKKGIRGSKKRETCRCCHIPYKKKMAPFDMKFHKCSVCKKGFVPEVLLSTIEPPQEIQMSRRSMFFEARVCREKKKAQGEQNAMLVSESIPFIEYDLHRQMLYKLKLLGMNAAFAIKYQLAISESFIVGVATATAVFISALPHPPVLHINRNLESSDKHLLSIQNKIEELSKLNHSKLVSSTESEFHNDIIGNEDTEEETLTFKEQEEYEDEDQDEEEEEEEEDINEEYIEHSSSSSEEEDIHSSSHINNNNASGEFNDHSISDSNNEDKDKESKEINEEDTAAASSTYVVQVDDTIDEETISLLLEPKLPPQFNFCTTQSIPLGPNKRLSNIQFLTAIRRVELDVEPRKLNQHFSAIFHSLYSSIIFKMRSLTPCCICCVNVDVQLPNENEVQIIFTAMASLIVDDLTTSAVHKHSLPHHIHSSPSEPSLIEQSPNMRRGTSQDSALSNVFLEETPLPFVQITPMSFIPGTHLVKFIGRINIHLVKESFTVREQGNLAGFTHRFLNEINAIVKAHVASLGANALLSYKIEECSIKENQSKNQSYSLVSISGDAFLVMRNIGTPFTGLKKLVDVSKQ